MFFKYLCNDMPHNEKKYTLRIRVRQKRNVFLIYHFIDVINRQIHSKFHLSSITLWKVSRRRANGHEETLRVLRRVLRNPKNILFKYMRLPK